MTTVTTESAGDVDGRQVHAVDVVEDEGRWSVVATVEGHDEPVTVSTHRSEADAVAAIEALTEALAADGDIIPAPAPLTVDQLAARVAELEADLTRRDPR